LQKLRELKLDKNTIVIFFSDNGGHGGVTTHYPLRGSKGMMYEGGFREPMIVRWPEKIKPNTISKEIVIGLDFYSTFVELAGGDPKKYNTDGESLVPILLNDGSIEREAIYWHFPAYLQSYKGIKNPSDLVRGWRAVPSSAIRKGDWKLIEDFEDGSLQLYNLREDISESNNLSENMPKKRTELLENLRSWRQEVNARVPRKRNPEYRYKKN